MTNDEIIREIERLSREVNMLKGSNLASMGAQSIMSGDIQMLGQTTIRIPIIYALSTGSNPTDPDANGVFMNAFGETFDGTTLYQLGGVKDGGLMFGLRSTDGSALFMGGQGIIDNTGINTTGINYGMRQYAVDPTDPTTTRYFRLEMLLPDGRTQPAGSLTFTTGDETNLITNGDAETGDLSNWTQSDTLWSADSSEYRGGAYSFKFDNNLSTAETLTSDRYAASASKIYSISAWMKDYHQQIETELIPSADTYLRDVAPTTNYGSANSLFSGWSGSEKYHWLAKYDYSSIPENIYSVLSSELQYFDHYGNSQVYNVYRCLRAWVEGEATWNIYSTGNNWGTAGAENTTSDRESSAIGTKSMSLNQFYSVTLDNDLTKEMIDGSITNNGFVMRGTTESGATARYGFFASKEWAETPEPAYHKITYIEASKYTVYMKWYDDASAGNLIRTDTLFIENNTNSWNERTATVTAPAGALSYAIVISGDKGREFWVDDIVVAEQTFANKLLFLPELSYQDSDSTRRILSAKKELYAPLAPVIALVATASGNCTNGAHLCKITFVDSDGETEASAASNSVTVDGTHKQITCTLEVGPWGTTSRNIYMTEAGGTTYKLVGTQADNTTASYTINVADANLTTVAPVVNFSGSRPLFPRSNTIFCQDFYISNANYSIQTDTGQLFNVRTGITGANAVNGDYFICSMCLDGGVYDFYLLAATLTAGGIFDVYLDNVLISSGNDTYSAGVSNVVFSFPNITVSGSGYHKIMLKINGKNPSGSYYVLRFTYLSAVYNDKNY